MAFALLLFLGLAGLLLVARRFDRIERGFMAWGFAGCVAAAVAQVLVTTYFFGGGDQDTYFRHAQHLSHRMSLNFSGYAPEVLKLALRDSSSMVSIVGVGPGSPTGAMNGLTALVVFAVGDSIFATCLFFALLAFFSKIAFYQGLRIHSPVNARRSCLLACLATPSVVFWTSGILKESVAMTGLGISVLGASMLAARRIKGLPILVVGGFIAYLTKPYVIAALAVTLPAWYFVTWTKARNRVIRPRHLALAIAAAAAGAVLVGQIVPDFAVSQLSDSMDQLQRVGQRVEGGTNYSLGRGGSNLAAQLALAPLGLLSSLFRPLPFEISNVMVLVASLEITALALWLLVGLMRAGPRRAFGWLVGDELLFAAAAFVLVFGTAVGLASTNLGSLARYRVPMMPFWALIVFELRRRSRLTQQQAVAGRSPPREETPPTPVGTPSIPTLNTSSRS